MYKLRKHLTLKASNFDYKNGGGKPQNKIWRIS